MAILNALHPEGLGFLVADRMASKAHALDKPDAGPWCAFRDALLSRQHRPWLSVRRGSLVIVLRDLREREAVKDLERRGAVK